MGSLSAPTVLDVAVGLVFKEYRFKGSYTQL